MRGNDEGGRMKWFIEFFNGVTHESISFPVDMWMGRSSVMSACGEGRNTGRAWNEATD